MGPLSSLFLCGHLLAVCKLFHACRDGDVLHATRSYAVRMAVAVVVGGPSCALALSAVFEGHARSVASPRALGAAKEAAAQIMQFPYLGVLLVTLCACVATVTTSTPSELHVYGGGIHGTLHYMFWPADYFHSEYPPVADRPSTR